MGLQTCLFSESSLVETGLWCELNEGIDPRQWARLCRFLGHLGPQAFTAIAQTILGHDALTPTATQGSTNNTAPPARSPAQAPLVSLGPSGLGGSYQREIWK